MAKATATCTCTTCGKKFEATAYKNNRKSADEWEEWASSHYDECTECYRERKKIENAEKAENYALPVISAVSEKQAEYAKSLRDRYVAEYEENITRVLKLMEQSKGPEFIAKCEGLGLVPEEECEKILKRRYPDAYICVTETNASKIIETLRGW